MKKLRLIGLVVLILASGVIAALFLQYSKLAKLNEGRLAEHRKKYADELRSLVSGSASPEAAADIHAFLSAASLNQALAFLHGHEFPISDEAKLTIASLTLRSDEGTPLIELQGEIRFTNSPTGLNVRGVCTLAHPEASGNALVTRLHIVTLEPSIKGNRWKLAVNGQLGEIIKAVAQERLDKRPSLTLPIQQEFEIPVAGSEQPVSFKTRHPASDTLHGTLTLKGFDLRSSLKLSKAVFLTDGFHAFLKEDAEIPAPADDPRWIAMSMNERLKTLSEPDASYFARVRLDSINRLIKKITNLPKEHRTVSFKSTRLDGNLYYWDRVQRGPLGIGVLYREVRKAYLEHPDSASAKVEVLGLHLESRSDALVGLKLDAALEGKVQVHWHYDPGPSGGVGGNVGVRVPRKNQSFKGSIRLIQDPAPVLEGHLDGPDNINLSVSVGLGQLGNIGFSADVPLPLGKLFSAPIPSGLSEQVFFRIGAAEIKRNVRVSDLTVSQLSGQLRISGKMELVTPP